MYAIKKGQAYYTNRHSCFLLQYHILYFQKKSYSHQLNN